MFIFADETGHSGKEIFNPPEEYKLGSIFSVSDIEPLLQPLIKAELALIGGDRIHANDRMVHENVKFANAIMDILDASGTWLFNLAVIEKRYVAITKFVDMIFDSGENSAVAPHWYGTELLRHQLCLACLAVLTDKNTREFWTAFLKSDLDALKSCVANARIYAIRLIRDNKLRQVVITAFDFFLRYPENFTLEAGASKKSYQGHTPNMIAFSCLLTAMNVFAEKNDSPPIAFVHDRQDEFKKTMVEWYKIFGPMVTDDNEKGWWPKVRKTLHALPELTIAASSDSASLQAVDTLLWVERRETGELELEACRERLRKTSDAYFIASWMSQLIVDMRMMQLAKTPFGPADELRARSFLSEIETQRDARVKAAMQK